MSRSEISRRRFLTAIGAAGLIRTSQSCLVLGSAETRRRITTSALAESIIDRRSLVSRHSPSIHKLDPFSPLSVGNGEFAFTADITGLQTFPTEYETRMPLCTMSQWGWHNTPLPGGLDPNGFRLTQYDTHGRSVGYRTRSEGQTELYNWLRENPHRLYLGRIGLLLKRENQGEAQSQDLSDVEQRLDLWTGILTSQFRFNGRPVTVKTAAHPTLDLLAVAIESRLIQEGKLAVRFAFPYGSPGMEATDWKQPSRHESKIIHQQIGRADLRRGLETNEYFVAIGWSGNASFEREDQHRFLLTSSRARPSAEFVTAFSPGSSPHPLPGAAETFKASADHWQQFWTSGGAIELADSKDPRAPELERRLVLSQYLTAIQCAGSMPPQETGLTVNSWYGKFHLEMHWLARGPLRLVEPPAAAGKESKLVRARLAERARARTLAGLSWCALAKNGWT